MSESKDKRTGWLRELKVGDTVVISSGSRDYIKTVSHITPTGRITVGDSVYGPDGDRMGRTDKWTFWRLREPTKELLDKLSYEDLANRVHSLATIPFSKYKQISTEDLLALKAVLEKYKE